MGVVYAALDSRLNRKIALKVMLSEFAADPAAAGWPPRLLVSSAMIAA